MPLSETEGEVKALRFRKWWVALAILLMFVLGGLIERDGVFTPSKQTESDSDTIDKSPKQNLMTFAPKEKTTPLGSLTAGGNSEAASQEKATSLEQQGALLLVPSHSVSALVSGPSDLKLAIVNVQKILDESGKSSSDKKQVAADIHDAVETYSRLHGFDLVLDSSALSRSETPIFLYVRPGLTDITDEILAQINAKQSGK